MDFYSKRRSRSRVSSLTTGVVAIFNPGTSVAKAAVLIMNISRKEHFQPHLIFHTAYTSKPAKPPTLLQPIIKPLSHNANTVAGLLTPHCFSLHRQRTDL